MTCTFCLRLSASVRCTTCWKQHCVCRLASSCTQERHARGMLQGSALRTWRIWVPTCGTHRGSRFSDLLLGVRSSCPRSSNVVWPMNKSCGTPSPVCQTCNVRGKSCFSALDPVATICCAQFHRQCLKCMPRGTTQGCCAQWSLCWGHSQAIIPRSRWLATSRASPLRMGGLGLRSAQRLAPAAYWASWADALPMLQQRLPNLTRQVVECLSVEGATGCLGDLQAASRTLDRSGFVNRPSWEALQRGIRPQRPTVVEPGEWQHGWQYYSSSSSEYHFRETVVLAQSCAADQAHLRSHSGPCASLVVCGSPTSPEFTVKPHLYRTIILERLRLPLSITDARCECSAVLDARGQHRAACPRSGRLRSRAVPTERTLARVCREAGATVRCNAKLRDMNVRVHATDERSIEVLASGLAMNHGAQLAVDITLPQCSDCQRESVSKRSDSGGAVLTKARLDKETKYAELVESDRCQLVVVGIETGGRWSNEATSFTEGLAASRAREAPVALRFSSFLAWRKRWCRMLSVSCSRAFRGSLVSTADDQLTGTDGVAPELADLLPQC